MTYHLVYHCDSYPAIGLGHLARGIGVLAALRRRDQTWKLAICGTFSPSALVFLRKQAPADVDILAADVNPLTRVAVLDTMADAQYPERVDEARARDVAAQARRTVLISSSRSTQTYDCIDVLIDHMPDVKLDGPVPSVVLSGFEYAPVAKEFVDLGHRQVSTARLAAIVGGNDTPYGPRAFVKALSIWPSGYDGFDLVVSPHVPAGEVEALKADFPAVSVHQFVPNLAPIVGRARAVVCTYGNATYESLSLHKATFLVAYKAFQDSYGALLEDFGLVHRLGYFESLEPSKVIEALSDEVLLRRLSTNAATVFVAPGIERIGAVLTQELQRVSDRE